LKNIAGRNKSGIISGDVLINGKPRADDFVRISAYVMQDDCLIGELTVWETLMYSTRLRVSATNREREGIVNKIINLLGLGKIAHSRVGTPLKRGRKKIQEIFLIFFSDRNLGWRKEEVQSTNCI
jgi:ATP-binding cassette subfamily G (WHITE) protein 2 (PDR)